MPYFENCGAQLYYQQQGEGQALLFLHGASWDMHQWDRQVRHFSPKYKVITMDARGHGRSTLPPGKVSSDVLWRDVRALLDHLQIEKAIICGLSMGGHVAIQTAINAPERVERLILIGTPCTNSFNLYERVCLPINRLSMRLMPMSWIAWCMCFPLGKFNPETKDYVKDVVGRLNHNNFNRMWQAVTRMESREGLPRIKCPTLILVGDHDSMTRRQQPYIQEHISGSRLVIIKNAHHGTNLDNPEQVEQEIEAFLQ